MGVIARLPGPAADGALSGSLASMSKTFGMIETETSKITVPATSGLISRQSSERGEGSQRPGSRSSARARFPRC